MTAHRRGWSSAESEEPKEWTAVVNPQPVFDGVEEMRRYEDAVSETKRRPGESLADYMGRVVAAAQAAAPREPGGEG